MGPHTRLAVAASFVALGVGCAAPVAHREDAAVAAPAASEQALERIDHVTPTRDSVGAVPTRLEWTAVKGADRYFISVWNEVDVTLWRQDDIPETSAAWPPELRLEPGTYFWAVAARRGDRPVGESGRAAFVVRQ